MNTSDANLMERAARRLTWWIGFAGMGGPASTETSELVIDLLDRAAELRRDRPMPADQQPIKLQTASLITYLDTFSPSLKLEHHKMGMHQFVLFDKCDLCYPKGLNIDKNNITWTKH